MAVKLLLLILCMTDPNQHPYLSYQTVASWLAIGIVVLLQLGAILSLLLQFSIVSIRPYICMYVACGPQWVAWDFWVVPCPARPAMLVGPRRSSMAGAWTCPSAPWLRCALLMDATIKKYVERRHHRRIM